MDIYREVDLLDCPCCGGAGLLEEENGWCWYVVCMDCGAQTGYINYKKEEDKLAAAQKAAGIWNMGKVVNPSPGE